MPKQKLLTLKEISKYLNIHQMTLYKMAQQGRLPASKVGRVWRFRKERINDWLDKQENNYSKRRLQERLRA